MMRLPVFLFSNTLHIVGIMKRKYALNILVLFQLMALFMVQVNASAPGIAQLYPALAAGDFGECHCGGCCSAASRANGTCCCKQAKKLKLKMHCVTNKAKTRELSLSKCPCGGSSQFSFASPENQVFLAYTVNRPLPEFQEYALVAPETPSPRSILSKPPIPPPRLNLTT
jgi:hypothetical protein